MCINQNKFNKVIFSVLGQSAQIMKFENMKKNILIATILWVFAGSISLIWNLKTERENHRDLLFQAAQNQFKQMVFTRSWNSNHGSVYVPVTDKFSPNPYLKDSLRDVITTNGLRLTKINPALMTRQIGEVASLESDIQYHITSLNPIRPENKAAAWETRALKSFEKINKEFGEFTTENNGKRVFRYMAPLIVQKSCLKCHAQQGYELGDIRGGISITIPLKEERNNWQLWISHIIAMIVGAFVFMLLGNSIERSKARILLTNKTLLETVENLKNTQIKLKKSEHIVGTQKEIKSFITIAQYLTNLTSYQNIRTEITRIVRNIFDVDVICFADKNALGEIKVLKSHAHDCLILNLITDDMKEDIAEVIGSEFLSTYKVTEPDNYSLVILPLRIGSVVKEVIIFGHKTSKDISTERLEIYLGISSFAGTMINRLLLHAQLEESNQTLEAKVKERTNILKQQKEVLAKALQQLKESQSQLILSEKMASLGQLIASIAHEINNPLSAIKASVQIILNNMKYSVQKQHELFTLLSKDRMEDYILLLNKSLEQTTQLSSIEMRNFRKKIEKQLDEQDIKDAESIADTLVDMGITDDITAFIPLLKGKNAELILDIGYNISNQHKSSVNIKTAVDKTNKIIFALKNYARYSEKETKVNANIINGIETVLTLYNSRLKEGIELIKNYEDIPEILCFPDELNQVWTNLINNAAYAMDYKGTLEISVNKTSSHISVKIKDSGKGIPEEIADKIFNPFFTSKPIGEGSGLGLDIVKKIIEKHDGTIEFESTAEQGTEFTITLPS